MGRAYCRPSASVPRSPLCRELVMQPDAVIAALRDRARNWLPLFDGDQPQPSGERPTREPWTPAEDALLLELPTVEVATRTGRSLSACWNRKRKIMGIISPLRFDNRSPVLRAVLTQLEAAGPGGIRGQAIANAIKTDWQTVGNALRRLVWGGIVVQPKLYGPYYHARHYRCGAA